MELDTAPSSATVVEAEVVAADMVVAAMEVVEDTEEVAVVVEIAIVDVTTVEKKAIKLEIVPIPDKSVDVDATTAVKRVID